MDKVREEFEKEYLASMNPHFFENEEQKKVYLKTDNDGNYIHDCTRLAYLWFVKGRESVVIKLPEPVIKGMACVYYNHDIENALENAGVNYK